MESDLCPARGDLRGSTVKPQKFLRQALRRIGRRIGIYQDGERAERAMRDLGGHGPSSGVRAAMISMG